ncbi:MAG: endospore germination permease [Paenibacillus macerans]|uniref:GerAB/ArcD/ProY family transporter n=1 Tax=Paenibacillus macerans TaxID=44252 RepID=UPI002915A07E|nr:endospore germination permease [Paenibacillus macerans]MDU7475599.1 endospore germination permease [Paenibacillus macerans]
MNEVQISVRQLTIITIFFTVGSAILITPSGMVQSARQDAWIAGLIGIGVGLLTVWFMCKLVNLYPQKNLIEILETLLGKWVGKTVSLLFISSLFLGAPAAVLNDLGDFMTTQMMPETPIEAIIILFGTVILMGVRLGIEVVARSAELLFPWFVLLYLLLVLLVSFNIDPRQLQPVLENGSPPIWQAVLTFISVAFLPHISLLLILPASVNRPAQFGKGIVLVSLVGSLMLVIVIILSILVLGVEITSKSLFPSYVLAQKIDIGHFLQRVETIVAVMWFFSLYFRITLYMSSITVSLAQIFNLKDYRPLVWPLGMLLIVMSFVVYPNVPFRQAWDARTWPPYILTVGLLLPLLLLTIHGLRRLFKKKQTKQA